MAGLFNESTRCWWPGNWRSTLGGSPIEHVPLGVFFRYDMIEITLPDGSKRPFDHPVTVQDVAASIGAGLAKAALAGKVDGKLVDTSFTHRPRRAPARSSPTRTPRRWTILRHSTAHLLAQAVQRLFPGAQVTIGPVIDNGFFYDFAYERPFTPDDLPKIEAEMQKIVKEATAGDAQRDVARRGGGVLPRHGRGATRPRSSSRSRPTRTCRCTRRASSPTCAAARTCRTPASCARSS